jgi:alkaline phosphatase
MSFHQFPRALLFCALSGLAYGQAQPNPEAPSVPKNIILFIADGWGYNHIEGTNYWEHGQAGAQVYEREFTHYAMTTFSQKGHGYDPKLAWSDFGYLKRMATDSAAAATTMSTGLKTVNGAIGVDENRNPLLHAFEVAEQRGKATGVVTTVQWSHATPAAFVAHDRSRGKYEELAKEMVNVSAVDVIMGCGNPDYDVDGKPGAASGGKPHSLRYVGEAETWNALKAGTAGGDADGDGIPDPWTPIQSREEFQKLASGETPKRVLGCAQNYETLQQSRTGIDGEADDDAPFETPLLATSPTLAEMALAAVNVLDNDPDGFCLMLEGGAVDWASHDNQTGRMIEEMLDFNRAIDAVVDWVKSNGGWEANLVMVTGDHECGYLLGPGSDPELKPVQNNGKGVMPKVEWHYKSHTNSLIPLFVKGAGADRFAARVTGVDPKRGPYLDNTAIGLVTHELLGGAPAN